QALSSRLDCFLDDLPSFDRRFLKGSMISVAVSRFHEDEVGLLEGDVVPVQRGAARAKVSREDHDFLLALILDRQLEAYRAEHVPRFGGPNGNPRRQPRRLVVAKLLVEG